MRYEVTGEFTKISETTGTIQNMSNVYAVEVSNKAEADSGIILYPLNRISVTLSECYLRCVDGGNAEVRVVPFEVDVTRGGGSSAAGTSNLTDVFRSLEVIDGKVNFYGTTDKSGDILASFNMPEEIFLNQVGTIVVHDFMFSALAYPNSTNPNLDGKTVLVLSVKGDKKTNPTIKYVFVDLQKLVDKYLASNKSINISGYSIAVNISDDTKNLLALKEDGLFVGSDDSKLDKVPSAVQDNIPVFDVEGTIIDGGLSFADLEYELPTASVTTKGGVKVGSGLAITGDTLNVTISGGASYADFKGATSISSGLSGLVPAPSIGDEEKFLRGDGTWANVSSGGASYANFVGATSISGGVTGLVPAPGIGAENYFLRGDGNWASVVGGDESTAYVLSDHVSTIEGGFWAEEIGGVHAMRLRLGNYIYNFNSSSASYDSGSSATATVQPDTYFLDTVPSSEEGGVWYSTDNGEPKICFHSGNYNYGIAYDTVTWVGGNTNLVSYLPFNASTTLDALGNTWTAYGNPTIVDNKLYLDGNNSYLVCDNVASVVGAQPWAIDFWATVDTSAGGAQGFFGTYNSNYTQNYSGYGTNYNVAAYCIPNGEGGVSCYGMTALYSPCPAAGERHHYAATYDGTTVRFFADGQLKASEAHDITLAGPFLIGALSMSSGWRNPFKGTIDHFRIFKAAIWTENFTPPTESDYL